MAAQPVSEPHTGLVMAKAASIVVPVYVGIAGLVAMHDPNQHGVGMLLLVGSGVAAGAALVVWPLFAMAASAWEQRDQLEGDVALRATDQDIGDEG